MAKKAATKTSKQLTQTKRSPVAQLDLELGQLQSACDAAEIMYVSARNELYTNIARVYLWWLKADAQKGYLDAKIEQMGGLFKKESKHGYNFSPVLQLVYGNSISDYEISKRGRVLNLLDEEYKKAPKKYGTDVVKLANHINQKGGLRRMVQDSLPDVPSLKVLEKLVKQQEVAGVSNAAALPSSVELNVAKQNAVDAAINDDRSSNAKILEFINELRKPKYLHKANDNEKVRITPAIKQAKLTADAEAYWRKHSGLGLVGADFGFDTNTGNFGLAVIKRDAKGVAVVDTFIDDALIKHALVAAYEKQYAALPDNMRCMYETLKTQLLPKHVADQVAGKLDDSDIKVPSTKTNNNKETVKVQVPLKATPRFIYMGKTNQFVLSPIGSSVGVCAIVTPTVNVMAKCGYDVYMHHNTKKVAEQMLNEQTMNCYRPASSAALQAQDKPYRHSLQVTSVADPSDFYFLTFYPFLAQPLPHYGQAMFDIGYEKTIKTKYKFPRGFAHALAKNGADKWLAGKGNHAARSSNRFTQLTVTSKSLRLEFDYKEGKALAFFEFPMPSSTKLTSTYKQKFVCLDLMPVLSALGALELTADVQVLLDKNVAVFKFATDAGKFVVAVPTCDDKGKRNKSVAFSLRTPDLYKADSNYIDLTLETYFAQAADYFPVKFRLEHLLKKAAV
jgi:hypothetical protein